MEVRTGLHRPGPSTVPGGRADGESEIIDVGRKTRVIPTALRRAVIARDRHCTHQGCDRPARWCDVHHKIHWADGGETSLENLRLLCRFHHNLTHHHTKEPIGTRSI
ncbi:MAG: HNH endonuclease signature motif containing protein [Actinobacteria bacterium]|nr:HNH endonuclease signature motif containing protein [Actinomycetota bacterium]MCZ6738400.1 HNH endonuclease signature motif containing protein [Actinomycetota bacterium]